MKNCNDTNGIRTSDLPICSEVTCSSTVTPCLGILLKLNSMKTRPVAAQLVPADTNTDERADRHNDFNGPFSYFCEGAFKHNKWIYSLAQQQILNIYTYQN